MPNRGQTDRSVRFYAQTAGASFYDVQIFRGSRLVRSAYPAGAGLRVAHLRPGRYRWYVWPGYGGSRADGHYGRLLGQSRFTVR